MLWVGTRSGVVAGRVCLKSRLKSEFGGGGVGGGV